MPVRLIPFAFGTIVSHFRFVGVPLGFFEDTVRVGGCDGGFCRGGGRVGRMMAFAGALAGALVLAHSMSTG